MDDNILDEILSYKVHFDSDERKRVSALITKHTLDYPPEWIKKRRIAYLETITDEIRFDILIENVKIGKYQIAPILGREYLKALFSSLNTFSA